MLLCAWNLFSIKKTVRFSNAWGWYRPNTSDIPFIDFHLAGRGTLIFKNEKKHIRYNFCSRNFIQKYLKKEIEKKWDILMM